MNTQYINRISIDNDTTKDIFLFIVNLSNTYFTFVFVNWFYQVYYKNKNNFKI